MADANSAWTYFWSRVVKTRGTRTHVLVRAFDVNPSPSLTLQAQDQTLASALRLPHSGRQRKGVQNRAERGDARSEGELACPLGACLLRIAARLLMSKTTSVRSLSPRPQGMYHFMFLPTQAHTHRKLQIVAFGFAFSTLISGALGLLFAVSFVLRRQVINTLGVNKEEMAEVQDTFDAELLALSRINTPQIVKVHCTRMLCGEFWLPVV